MLAAFGNFRRRWFISPPQIYEYFMKNDICSLIFPKFDISWWGLMAPLGGLVMVKRGRRGDTFLCQHFFHLTTWLYFSLSSNFSLKFFFVDPFFYFWSILCYLHFSAHSSKLHLVFYKSHLSIELLDQNVRLRESISITCTPLHHIWTVFGYAGPPLGPLQPSRPTPWPLGTL